MERLDVTQGWYILLPSLVPTRSSNLTQCDQLFMYRKLKELESRTFWRFEAIHLEVKNIGPKWTRHLLTRLILFDIFDSSTATTFALVLQVRDSLYFMELTEVVWRWKKSEWSVGRVVSFAWGEGGIEIVTQRRKSDSLDLFKPMIPTALLTFT